MHGSTLFVGLKLVRLCVLDTKFGTGEYGFSKILKSE